MTFDGLTAAILAPALERGGWTLADLAAALARAAEGGYTSHHYEKTNRGYLWFDFTTVYSAIGRDPIELIHDRSGHFGSPQGRRVIKGLPYFWGGIRKDGDDHLLAVQGIRLGSLSSPVRMVMMTPHRPMLAIIGVDLPLAVRQSIDNKPLREVISSPALDGIDIRVVRWRDIAAEKLGEIDQQSKVDAIGAKLKTLPKVRIPFEL